jgi:hypothetical protein
MKKRLLGVREGEFVEVEVKVINVIGQLPIYLTIKIDDCLNSIVPIFHFHPLNFLNLISLSWLITFG